MGLNPNVHNLTGSQSKNLFPYLQSHFNCMSILQPWLDFELNTVMLFGNNFHWLCFVLPLYVQFSFQPSLEEGIPLLGSISRFLPARFGWFFSCPSEVLHNTGP